MKQLQADELLFRLELKATVANFTTINCIMYIKSDHKKCTKLGQNKLLIQFQSNELPIVFADNIIFCF